MQFLGKILPGVISSFAGQYLPKIAGWAGKKLSGMGHFANQMVDSIQNDTKLGQRLISSWSKGRNKGNVSLTPQSHAQKLNMVQNPNNQQQDQYQDQQQDSPPPPPPPKKRKPILKRNKRVSFK